MKRKIYTLTLLMFAVVLSATAQSGVRAKKEAVFIFSPYSTTFMAPRWGNEAKLQEVYNFIDKHRGVIEDGSMPIYVNGHYSNPRISESARKDSVYLMSHQVKSDLILKAKVKERNFITKNSTEAYSEELPNVVVVRFVLPETVVETTPTPKEQPKAEPVKEEPKVEPIKEEVVEQVTTTTQPTEPVVSVSPKSENPYKFALRTNLLHWALATPNIGVEWRPTALFSVVVDADYAPWSWNDKLNYYRMWNVQPQVRFYVNCARNLYVGGEFHVGDFNWKLKTKGHQGDFIGGGLVVGYSLRLNRSLDLDFNLGGGYTNYKYDKYETIGKTLFPYEKGLTKNYWGITSAGVSLVWKICK